MRDQGFPKKHDCVVEWSSIHRKLMNSQRHATLLTLTPTGPPHLVGSNLADSCLVLLISSGLPSSPPRLVSPKLYIG